MPSYLSWCTAQQEHSFWYQPTKSLSLPPGLALGSCNKACLHVGTSWIPVTSLTAKLCLEHSFSTSFYQTQPGVDAQPFNHVHLSPEEKEDFMSSYVWDDETKHGNTTWSAKPCALVRGWNHMRCKPRWSCRGIQLGCLQMHSGRYPHKTAETLSLVVQRDTISVYFTHVSISQSITRQVFFQYSTLQKACTKFPNSFLHYKRNNKQRSCCRSQVPEDLCGSKPGSLSKARHINALSALLITSLLTPCKVF